MIWTEEQKLKLRELCHQGYGIKAIAVRLNCTLTEVYAKRSQLGITIAKCKGIEVKPEFEQALEPIKPKGYDQRREKSVQVIIRCDVIGNGKR